MAGLPVLILAGGLGQRLRPVLRDRPKALAPVAGRPFLDYQLEWLRRQGLRRIILCLGYKADSIRRRYRDGHQIGMDITCSVERKPLGTAGAVKNAESLIESETFAVLNGDTLCEVNVDGMSRFHQRHCSLATIALTPVRDADRFGSVRMDRGRRILGFHEKQSSMTRLARSNRHWINAGMYLLQREVLEMIPSGRSISLETEIFPALVSNRLFGFPAHGYFLDIGVPGDYARAQREVGDRFAS